jgi:hypothetical protein
MMSLKHGIVGGTICVEANVPVDTVPNGACWLSTQHLVEVGQSAPSYAITLEWLYPHCPDTRITTSADRHAWA